VSGQTVRVSAVGGNQKLDTTGRISVTFDIGSGRSVRHVHSIRRKPRVAVFDQIHWLTGLHGQCVVRDVTDCAPGDCKAAPAVANDYFESINFALGRRHGEIISAVAQRMTEGARFDGIDPCNVEAYRAAVVAFVISLLRA
jgi:hypothetical protein